MLGSCNLLVIVKEIRILKELQGLKNEMIWQACSIIYLGEVYLFQERDRDRESEYLHKNI